MHFVGTRRLLQTSDEPTHTKPNRIRSFYKYIYVTLSFTVKKNLVKKRVIEFIIQNNEMTMIKGKGFFFFFFFSAFLPS